MGNRGERNLSTEGPQALRLNLGLQQREFTRMGGPHKVVRVPIEQMVPQVEEGSQSQGGKRFLSPRRENRVQAPES